MPATILLVDADSSNRASWEALLENHGYKVFLARSGKAALAECSRIQPDLILIEGPLPDIQEFEICRQLKAAPMTQLVPLVLILPSADPLHGQLGERVRADDFWTRPGSRWEALSRVQALLQLKSCIEQQAESVVFSLARSIEAKDPSTAGHSERVLEYAAELGERLGLSKDELAALRLASIVHDIGKVGVPDSILFKPERLSAEEMEVMRQHPVVGEGICAPLKSFRDALPAIRHHHERMDGSGYPDGLVGKEIPFAARILQVVDIYDALTSDRPYRRALSSEMALSVLSREMLQGWLDPELVKEFTQLRQSEIMPVTSEVVLFTQHYA